MKNIVLNSLLSAGIITLINFSGCSSSENRSQKSDSVQVQRIQPTQDVQPVRSIAGTYEFGGDIEKGPVGMVKIHPSGDSILFYIDVNRGAPSYNMGQLAGKTVFKDGTAGYKVDNCQIRFRFKDKSLNLIQEGDCEFGHGVDVSGEYKLKDARVPLYYIKSDGDTVRFQP